MNGVILSLCNQFVECDNRTSVKNQFNQLKLVDAQQLMIVSASLRVELTPVPFDGIFYTEDVLAKYMSNDLTTGYKLIVGINSYEASVLDGFRLNPDFALSGSSQWSEALKLWNIETGSAETENSIFEKAARFKFFWLDVISKSLNFGYLIISILI